MRNLKKMLSLALVFAMALTLMAGATAGAYFTDASEIVNKDAVNVVSALSIIQGYPDGAFQPEKVVTRAEMAKMIYVLKNGGVDDGASYYTGLSTPLSDVNGHWAEGYIKYCYSLGIIAGKGNNLFDPDTGVTGLEAAKMLLIVIGYNADRASLVGNSWAIRTAALATDAGLFEDFSVAFANACPRDYAALLIYNAIEAETVLWSTDYGDYARVTLSSSGVTETVGRKYLSLLSPEGILTGSGYAGWGDTGEGVLSIDDNDDDDMTTVSFSKVTADYSDLLGQRVKVLYKSGDRSKVYGVFATSDNTVVETKLSGIDKLAAADGSKTQITVGGTNYRLSERADSSKLVAYSYYNQDQVPFFQVDTTTANPTKASFLYEDNLRWAPATSVRLISNDGDSRIDLAVVVPALVYKVTVNNTSSFSATTQDVSKVSTYGWVSNLSSVSKTDSDYVLYDDMDKDDIVLVTPANYSYDGKTHLEKMDATTETVQATDSSKRVRIGGTWYSKASDRFGAFDDTYTPSSDDTVNIVIVGSTYYYIEKESGTATNMVFVAAAETDSWGGASYVKAYVMFTDGSTKTLEINRYNGTDISDYSYTSSQWHTTLANQFFTYSTSGSYYRLSDATTSNTGYDTKGSGTYAYSTSKKEGTVGSQLIADDAAVIVKYKMSSLTSTSLADTYSLKYVAGSAAKKWGRAFTNAAAAPYYTIKESDGYEYVYAAAILSTDTSTPGSASDYRFGYMLRDIYTVTQDGDDYYGLLLYTGGSETAGVEYLIETADFSGSTSDYKKGTAVAYTVVSGTTIDDVRNLYAGAIRSVNSTYISFYSNKTSTTAATYEAIANQTYDRKDAYVVYVDSDNTKGSTGGTLSKASDVGSDYVINCYYLVDNSSSSEELLGIVYDINNDWKAKGDTIYGTGTVVTPTTYTAANMLALNASVNGVDATAAETGVKINGTNFAGTVTTNASGVPVLTVTGNVSYTTGYTSFSTVATEQEGYFVGINAYLESGNLAARTVTFGGAAKVVGSYAFDSTATTTTFISRIGGTTESSDSTNAVQYIEFYANSYSAGKTPVLIVDLTNVVCNP